MKRRQVLIGLGAVSGGGAPLTGTGTFTSASAGTGAFSSVEANRDISVQVPDEANA